MTFVFSPWYFVLIILVAAIVASILVFVRMDKKDRVIIDNFIKQSTEEATSENEIVKEEVEEEAPVEEKKE